MSKPSSSRACSHASRIRSRSIVTVAMSGAVTVRDVAGQRAPVRHCGDPVPLVRGRHAGLVRLVQADDPLHQRLRPRRAEGDVDVDRDDPVDALEDRVVVEHPAGARADAHRDHPLRLEHLVVDLAQRLGHLVRDAARDDEQVGLARRGAERLHPEAREVVARGDDRHHLDRAAGEPERVGPHRLRLRPAHGLLERRQPERALELASTPSSSSKLRRALRRPEQPLRLEPVVAQARSARQPSRGHQFSAPLRQM